MKKKNNAKMMKNIIRIIALAMVLLTLAVIPILMFTGCAASEEERLTANILKLESRVAELQTEIAGLEGEKRALADSLTDLKVESGTAKYVLTINIKQTHFTLDIREHLKDTMNDISIQIPVDKEYYDCVNVGDTIDDSFRMGSFIFKGSFGSWKITVTDKKIV